jgi:hypothetical protein
MISGTSAGKPAGMNKGDAADPDVWAQTGAAPDAISTVKADKRAIFIIEQNLRHGEVRIFGRIEGLRPDPRRS